MQKHLPLLITPPAARDIDRARDWCKRHGSGLAHRFTMELRAAIGELRDFPRRWAIWREPNIRRVVFQRTPYVLIYRLNSEDQVRQIELLAVLHQRQDSNPRFPESP